MRVRTRIGISLLSAIVIASSIPSLLTRGAAQDYLGQDKIYGIGECVWKDGVLVWCPPVVDCPIGCFTGSCCYQ
jgi:hypothetical protein